MITLTALTATPTDAPAQPVGAEHVILDEHLVGAGQRQVWWRECRVEMKQITLKAGDVAVVIPLAELWRLGEAHEPRLAPPPAS